MGPAIRLQNVGLKYGDNVILEDISHYLAAGQCHVIMGPNGGGKTSLLRSILGLTPFTGNIDIQWPERKGNIGYVPQKATFESSLPFTVMDFILLNKSRNPLFWRKRKKNKMMHWHNSIGWVWLIVPTAVWGSYRVVSSNGYYSPSRY